MFFFLNLNIKKLARRVWVWRIGIFSGRAVGGLILSVTLQISKSVYGITLTNGCLPTHQINSQQKIWLAKYTKKNPGATKSCGILFVGPTRVRQGVRRQQVKKEERRRFSCRRGPRFPQRNQLKRGRDGKVGHGHVARPPLT